MSVIVLPLGACASVPAPEQATGGRPNLIVIVSDDQRADSIGALGSSYIRTPNLDQLVEAGTTFTRAYCMGSTSGAVCAPSRAMFLSGRGMFDLGPNLFDLGEEIEIWPELLRAEGYRTFGTGKWHSGRASFARSFTDAGNVFFGGMGDHNGIKVYEHDKTGVYDKDRGQTIPSFSSQAFADSTIDFLETQDGTSPYVAYISFTAPHDPRTAPEGWEDRVDPASVSLPTNFAPWHPFDNGDMTLRDERLAPWPRTEQDTRRQIADYAIIIEHMDEQIGRILDAAVRHGDHENTYVVFYSDHGLAIGSHGLMGKQSLYEHSMRTPLVISGPGVEAGRHNDSFVYLLDVPATVCDLAGVEPPADGIGRSLKPALFGERFAGRKSVFTAYKDVQRAVREDRWKLICYPKINRKQLFDLKSDPDEMVDLIESEEHQAIAKRLERAIRRWQSRLGDSQPLSVDEPLPAEFDYLAAEQLRTGGGG